MNKIAAIRYIDAFYFLKGEGLKYTKFKTQIAVGWIRAHNDYLTLVFAKKNNVPQKGLLMRKGALIFDYKSEVVKFVAEAKFLKLSAANIGSDVGVFWEDIVYFEHGKIPDRPTVMYTEGKLFKITSDSIIVKNPETIKIKGRAASHHPKRPGGRLAYFVIPRPFITDVELYEGKN